jgi:hypothetical protein
VRPDPEVNYAIDPYGYRPPPRRRMGFGIAASAVVVLGLAGAVVYYYGIPARGVVVSSSGGPPVIEADPQPTKMRPENQGDAPVPNQDKLVFERLHNAKLAPTVERLLPPPEEPLPRPIVAPELPPPVAVTAPALASTGVEQSPAKPAETTPPADGTATPAPVQTADAPQPAPTAPTAPNASAKPPAKPAQPVGPVKPKDDAKPKDEIAAKLAALDADPTAKPSAPAGAAAQPAPLAAAGGARVQLASVRTEDEAKAEMQRLLGRYRDELGSLGLQIVRADLGDRGIYYRVLGAAIDDDRARGVCAKLRTLNVGCVVVRK